MGPTVVSAPWSEHAIPHPEARPVISPTDDPMSAMFFPLFSLALVVGWAGTRTALYLRHAKRGRREEIFMLSLCWSPLIIGLLALLLSYLGSHP